MFVCLSHFLSGAVGGRGLYIIRIFLRPGIMFVSLFVCMFVCLSHFLSGAVGGRGLYIITLLVPFKRCGVCS